MPVNLPHAHPTQMITAIEKEHDLEDQIPHFFRSRSSTDGLSDLRKSSSTTETSVNYQPEEFVGQIQLWARIMPLERDELLTKR